MKPDALKTDEERLNNTGWEEMLTASGKTYYTNRKTGEVLWRMPAELQEFRNREAARNLEAKLLKEDGSVSGRKDIDEQEEGQVTDEAGLREERVRDEVRQTYTQMFEEVGVTSTWKWEDFSRIVRDDDRYNLIKTISQKKLIFNEHIQTLRRREREEARVKKQIARDNFMKMLDASTILKPESKYYRTAHFFQGDPRWRILDEKERVELFQDYLDELEKREKEKKKQQRKLQMEQLAKLLGEKEGINYTTRWTIVCTQLAENPVFTALDKLDQLTVFRDWVIDMEKKVEEARKMEKRTGERKAREAFRALLKDKIEAGELTVCTHWRPFVHSLQDHSAYLNLVGQVGSTPKELFDDAVELLREQAEPAKSIVLKVCAEAGLELGPGVKWEEIISKLPTDLDSESGITRKALEDVSKWLLEEATVDQRDKARKKKKHEKLFDDFLHSLPVSSQSTLQDFRKELADARPKFKRLSDLELTQFFALYVEKIKVYASQEDEKLMEIEPGEIKKKSHRSSEHRHSKHKHHKKHKRHSSSSSVRKRHKHHSPSPYAGSSKS